MPKEWSGLKSLPVATQAAFQQLLARLRAKGRDSLTILFLGKTGAGKSSTINSLLGEKGTATVGALTANATDSVTAFTRTAAGFSLTLIDTPGLLEKDSISEGNLQRIKADLEASGRSVDAVFLFERMDVYRVEPIDHQVFRAVTDHFGRDIWKRTVLCLSRAGIYSPPDGLSYDDFVSKRVDAVQAAIRSAGCPCSPLPVALVENLRSREGEDGQLCLPNGR